MAFNIHNIIEILDIQKYFRCVEIFMFSAIRVII